MIDTIFYGFLYGLTIILMNTDIFKNITDNVFMINIILTIINCFVSYKYINNLIKLMKNINNIDINNKFILKIIYIVFNSIIMLTIIGYSTYETHKCYINKCLDSFDILNTFNIFLSIILITQLIVHLLFPYNLMSDNSDNVVINNTINNNKIHNIFIKMKYILIIITLSLCYNIFVPLFITIPNNIYIIIYHVYIIFFVILSFRLLFLTRIISFYDYLLFVNGFILLLTIICINIMLFINFNDNKYLPIIINFLFFIVISIIGIYMYIIVKRNISIIIESINNDTDLEYIASN